MESDTLSGRLRQALVEAMRTTHQQANLAARCGVSASGLCRFARGKGGLSLGVADRLAAELGLKLQQTSTWAGLDRSTHCLPQSVRSRSSESPG
jgi:hypothetical protein